MLKLIVPIALLLATHTSSASALTPIERLVLQELSCGSPPSPTELVRELAKAGLIQLKENIGYDSLSCWRIEGDLVVTGVSFSSICVFEEDEFIRSNNEDIYYRGPGTSPGQTLALGTTLDAGKLSDWYVDQFGPANVASAIDEGEMTILGDPSQVECSSWMH